MVNKLQVNRVIMPQTKDDREMWGRLVSLISEGNG